MHLPRGRRRKRRSYQSKDALIFQNSAVAYYTLRYLQNLIHEFPSIILQDHNVCQKVTKLLLTKKSYSDIYSFIEHFEYRESSNDNDSQNMNCTKPYETLVELFTEYGSEELYEKGILLFDDYFEEELKQTESETYKIDDQLQTLSELFKLNENEVEILRALYIYETSDLIDDVHRLVTDSVDIRSSGRSGETFVLTVPVMAGMSTTSIRSIISNSGQLKKMGILDENNELAAEIKEFIDGLSTTPLVSKYYRIFKEKVLPISYFSRLEKHIEIIQTLIENREPTQPLNILLYGVPGTGKTAFAQSLSKALKRVLFEVRINGESIRGESNSLFRKRAIAAAMNSSSTGDILMIDESDSLLNSASRSYFGTTVNDSVKEQVNEMLDRIPRVTFWITNRQSGMDSSTCRRMDYSIKFEPLNVEERMAIWRNAVKAVGVTEKISKKKYCEWAERYETSAGGITVALRNAKLLAQGGDISFFDAVDLIMKPHLEIMGQKVIPKRSKSSRYSLDAINVKNESLPEVVESVTSFVERIDSGEELMIPNYNILLYGVPGTGKTAFANHLAETINVPLVIRKASDLLGMYVGENEKNIAEAFAEAERQQGILFIDEADTFLSERSTAGKGWERSMVNEFLTQMEQFTGILICATNFREIVDTAATRRFVRKIEFDYLNEEGIRVLCKKYFGMNRRSRAMKKIEKLKTVTPGDFWTVYRTWYFLPKSKRENFDFVSGFEAECKEKGAVTRTIGFAA